MPEAPGPAEDVLVNEPDRDDGSKLGVLVAAVELALVERSPRIEHPLLQRAVVPGLHLDLEHLPGRIGRNDIDCDLPLLDALDQLDRGAKRDGNDGRGALEHGVQEVDEPLRVRRVWEQPAEHAVDAGTDANGCGPKGGHEDR